MKSEHFRANLQSLLNVEEDPFLDEEDLYEYLMGQVIQGLVEDGKEETAAMMLACRITFEKRVSKSGLKLLPVIHGPISIVKQLQERSAHVNNYDQVIGHYNENMEEFYSVLSLVVGPKINLEYSQYIRFQAEIVELPSNWRQELLEIVRKKGTTNQGLSKGWETARSLYYQNLRFRSQSEIKIAQAFDRHKVMYFANCTARVSQGEDRVNREPDFLVCQDGKWGALEVDGEPFHPPSRTVHDHERDRLFQKHGLRCIEHYDAQRCYQEPEQVVTEFLELLAKTF